MIRRRSATFYCSICIWGSLITLVWLERGPGGMANGYLTGAGPAQHSRCTKDKQLNLALPAKNFHHRCFLWLLGATVLVYLTCMGIILGMENGARFMKKKNAWPYCNHPVGCGLLPVFVMIYFS